MIVNKLFIFWLSASRYLAQIIEEPPTTDELASLTQVTVEILSTCYEKPAHTVGLAGISNYFLLEALYSQPSLAVALIGDDTHGGHVDRISRHKLQLFVVTTSSSKQLETTLRQIKSSLWWNHMGTFLILDWTSASIDEGCLNSFEFLWTAWQMNVLRATYLCLHRTRGRMVYSYNPYTSKAPEPWQYENTFKGKNGHPWTLFKREYDGDRRICKNLEFDKTNDLAGYKISATVKEIPPMSYVDVNATDINCIRGYVGDLARVVFHGLNATASLKVHDHIQRPGLLDTKGADIAMDTVDGISDILLVTRLHVGVYNYTVSFAIYESGFNIVTQYAGYQSQLQKLLTVLDRSTRIGLCLVALKIVIFFKFFRRESMGPSILNTLRIIANSGLTKVPKNQGARIYLASVFFLVVTIVGIYQGMLASLLTKSKPLPNVETMQDLRDRGFTIHTPKVYAHLFAAQLMENRLITHDEHSCTEPLLLDSSAACMGVEMIVFEAAVMSKLHISHKLVFKTSGVYVIRADWPLEERLNKVLAALTEAYITRYGFEVELQRTLSIVRFNDNLEKNRKFKVMTLGELTFAFVFLGIGLACATACFIVEVAISQFRSRIRNVKRGIRNRVRFK